jgi:hypothetical protein
MKAIAVVPGTKIVQLVDRPEPAEEWLSLGNRRIFLALPMVQLPR